MGREFQVEGTIYSINIYRALTLSQALPLGAGDTQMALAFEEVMDWGARCTDRYQWCGQMRGKQGEVGV